MGNIKEWICPKCKRTCVTKSRIFECRNCGYKPPIKDYKKAFVDLEKEYEAYKRDATLGMRTISKSCDINREEAFAFKVISAGLTLAIVILVWILCH